MNSSTVALRFVYNMQYTCQLSQKTNPASRSVIYQTQYRKVRKRSASEESPDRLDDGFEHRAASNKAQ